MSTAVLRQSALGVLVPEAEALVKPFRERYDPSAAEGVPAHITILVPFKPPVTITADVLETLRQLFAGFRSFTFALTEPRRFPDVLYLAPVPEAPFQALTEAVVERFPETPPYGGVFDHIVPHLTVAHALDREELDRIAQAFAQAVTGKLPVSATVTEVGLLDNTDGHWQVRANFPLGHP